MKKTLNLFAYTKPARYNFEFLFRAFLKLFLINLKKQQHNIFNEFYHFILRKKYRWIINISPKIKQIDNAECYIQNKDNSIQFIF